MRKGSKGQGTSLKVQHEESQDLNRVTCVMFQHQKWSSTTYTIEYYSAIKKNEITSFAATWMDLEIIILSEVSQKEKDK